MQPAFLPVTLTLAFSALLTLPTPIVRAQAAGAAASDWGDLKKPPALPFKKESVGDFSAPGVKVKGFFAGTPVTVDAAFTTEHEHTPPDEPFRVVVPKGKDILFLPGGKKTGAPELVRFTTATPDKQAIEILRFTTLTIPLQKDPAERLRICAELLKTQGLAAATAGYEHASILDTYATKVGDYDAVCVHAHMLTPDAQKHYAVKLVGILHPTRPGGAMAFLMAEIGLSEIKDPPDLESKGVLLPIIHSLRFLDAPGESGKR